MNSDQMYHSIIALAIVCITIFMITANIRCTRVEYQKQLTCQQLISTGHMEDFMEVCGDDK